MQLTTKSLGTMLQDMGAVLQGSVAQALDLSVGSVMRSLLEAVAALGGWLQLDALLVLTQTRAATSTGTDLDSWMADFNFARLPATSATGSVTFGRYVATMPAQIPIGTQVKTSDGTQSFLVVADATNPAWDGISQYVIGVNINQLTVAVTAVTAGLQGNVTAGSISVISSSLNGVDSVTNAAALAGGMDAEADAALRSRFVLFINSRSAATKTAVLNAIFSVQQGIRAIVYENRSASGLAEEGAFCVVADAGNGLLTPELSQAIGTAIEAIRPIGSQYCIISPNILPVGISFSLILTGTTAASAVAAAATALVENWVNQIGIAGLLSFSKIEALIHSADPSVVTVQDLTVNGNTADITAQWNQCFQVSNLTVN